MNGSAHRSVSPSGHGGRKTKLPPRLAKQREEKLKLEKFKIENWDNDMGKQQQHHSNHQQHNRGQYEMLILI